MPGNRERTKRSAPRRSSSRNCGSRPEKQPTIDPSRLKDRYVFFGFSAPGLLDLRPTPVNKVNPGVEIHAAVLDNVLSREFMRDMPRPWFSIFTLILALLSSALVIGARKVR